MPKPKQRSVSVVVPVRSEARTIKPLLDSLFAQTRRPDEVVVCDGTVETVESYARRGLPVKVLRAGDALPGRARNLAIREARGDLIALTDAGIRLDPHWLEHLLEPFANPSPPEVVYGRFEPVTASFRQRSIALAFVAPTDRRTGLRTPSAASMAMRRTVWEDLGGFREDLRSAEDLIFMRRVSTSGFSVQYAPNAVVFWNPPCTYIGTFRRFAAYSHSNIRAGLAREWQVPLLRIYLLTAVLTVSVLWTPLGGIFPLAMLGARAVKRAVREMGLAGAVHIPVLAGTMLALAIIDLATLWGSWRWLATERIFSGRSASAAVGGTK